MSVFTRAHAYRTEEDSAQESGFPFHPLAQGVKLRLLGFTHSLRLVFLFFQVARESVGALTGRHGASSAPMLL